MRCDIDVTIQPCVNQAGGQRQQNVLHSFTDDQGNEGSRFYPNIMPTSNDMPAPASIGCDDKTPTRA